MKIFLTAFLSLILFTGFGVFPQTTFAQTAECDDLRQKFQNADAGTLVESLPKYCTEGSLFTKITTLLYSITGVIAVIAIIYGGYIYMTARGSDEARKKGREILTYSIIGLIIVVFAATIVTIVSRYIVDNKLF